MRAWLERNPFLVLSFAGLALMAALVVRDLADGGPPPAIVIHEAAPSGEAVVVHVAGAVVEPDVYQLSAGARVHDAILAAGGSVAGANLNAINLARRLRDGERIEVPGPSAEVAAEVVTRAPGEKLDLNSATAEQLDTLPGIGEAYSRRIVDSRLVDGPYQTVEELLDRRVIPAATLDQIRDLVFVRAP